MTAEHDIDRALAELQHLPTSYISDGMGRIGLHGGWLAGLTARAMGGDRVSYVGRVLTVQWAPRQGRGGRPLSLYEVIRQRQDQTMLLVAGGRPDCYLLGDNTARAAKLAGFEAILVDGCIRDVATIGDVGIGVFSVGMEGGHPDSLEIVAYDLPVLFRGEWVQPGDVVAADSDGAVVFPGDRAAEVLHHARVIGELENEQDAVIRRQAPVEDILAVLRKKQNPE